MAWTQWQSPLTAGGERVCSDWPKTSRIEQHMLATFQGRLAWNGGGSRLEMDFPVINILRLLI